MCFVQLSRNVALAGGLGDPVAALILCTPGSVNLSVVNGEVVIRDGKLLTCDLEVSGWDFHVCRRQAAHVLPYRQQADLDNSIHACRN